MTGWLTCHLPGELSGGWSSTYLDDRVIVDRQCPKPAGYVQIE